MDHVDEKLPELEPRVSYSFEIKLVSNPLPVKCFCFKISFCVYMRYHNTFFADLGTHHLIFDGGGGGGHKYGKNIEQDDLVQRKTACNTKKNRARKIIATPHQKSNGASLKALLLIYPEQ